MTTDTLTISLDEALAKALDAHYQQKEQEALEEQQKKERRREDFKALIEQDPLLDFSRAPFSEITVSYSVGYYDSDNRQQWRYKGLVTKVERKGTSTRGGETEYTKYELATTFEEDGYKEVFLGRDYISTDESLQERTDRVLTRMAVYLEKADKLRRERRELEASAKLERAQAELKRQKDLLLKTRDELYPYILQGMLSSQSGFNLYDDQLVTQALTKATVAAKQMLEKRKID